MPEVEVIAMAIFHLKLLHAITSPLHSVLTRGFKTTIYSAGEIHLPRFSIYKITVVFFALSAIWHCFTWPNPIGVLHWNFSVRPQVNLKPQMSFVAKSHSAPQVSSLACSNDAKAIRSQSDTTQCKMDGKVNLGVDVRLKNAIFDVILTVYEIIMESVSLASEYASTMLRLHYLQVYNRSRTKLPVASNLSAPKKYFSVGDKHQKDGDECKNIVDDVRRLITTGNV
uniref:Uncharacterized protein n=1 Tax=Setaria digitata TaxID=48799 RepID=A0A915PLH4_9BILA